MASIFKKAIVFASSSFFCSIGISSYFVNKENIGGMDLNPILVSATGEEEGTFVDGNCVKDFLKTKIPYPTNYTDLSKNKQFEIKENELFQDDGKMKGCFNLHTKKDANNHVMGRVELLAKNEKQGIVLQTVIYVENREDSVVFMNKFSLLEKEQEQGKLKKSIIGNDQNIVEEERLNFLATKFKAVQKFEVGNENKDGKDNLFKTKNEIFEGDSDLGIEDPKLEKWPEFIYEEGKGFKGSVEFLMNKKVLEKINAKKGTGTSLI